MTSSTRMRVGAGVLAAGALVLGGCSTDAGSSVDDSTSTSTSASAEQSADFNGADVAFAQNMIVHHQGALEMARLASGRAQDPRVVDLAGRIESAQQPEIETMTGWLADWQQPTEPTGSGSMGGMDMGSGSPSRDTGMLQSASGADFDRMFLQMMIAHHTSAVDMAKTEVADGQNDQAVALAQRIVDAQTAEIQEMQTLLDELGS